LIGERVRLAREACRLTQIELSDLAGISQGTLSDLEAGRIMVPSDEVVEAVSRTTQFPVAFFSRGPLPDIPEGNYRKLKRGKSKISKQIRAQIRAVVEIVQSAEEVLQLPSVSLSPVDDLKGDLEELEECTQALRQKLGVGGRDPIPNLTRALERTGTVVVRLPTEMEDHDGFSVWPDFGLGGRPIIAISNGNPGDRDRFNMAHETGHLVLHTRRDVADPDRAEREANRFAGALLLPEEAAREAIRPPITLRVLMAVKATFGTSIAMNAQRAKDLRLISDQQFVSLRRQISARRWTRQEPVEVTPERPILIAKILSVAGSDGSTVRMAERNLLPPMIYRALTA